jgi:hypothetical protein
MKPMAKLQDSRMEDLFRSKLKNIFNLRHELVQLGELMDWARLEAHFAPYYSEAGGRGYRSGWWWGCICRSTSRAAPEAFAESCVFNASFRAQLPAGAKATQLSTAGTSQKDLPTSASDCRPLMIVSTAHSDIYRITRRTGRAAIDYTARIYFGEEQVPEK